jgi:hypothetical protein
VAHAKAYGLLEQSERLGMNALEATLEPYMEHLRNLEAECYREVMEGILRKQEHEKGAKAQVFLKRYSQALRLSMEANGCDLNLAKQEMKAWMSRGSDDYSGIRVGINLISQEGLLESIEPQKDALSA